MMLGRTAADQDQCESIVISNCELQHVGLVLLHQSEETTMLSPLVNLHPYKPLEACITILFVALLVAQGPAVAALAIAA